MQAQRDGTRSRKRRTRGQALVEFALVLPIFMLVLAGILDFGFLLYSRITIISAARDGARVAVSVDDKTTIGAIATSSVQASSVGLDSSAMTIDVTCVPAASGTCAFSGSAGSSPRLAKSGDSVRVVVTYPYHTFFPLFFGHVITIGATVQMVLE